MAESIGVGDCAGLSVELHTEIPLDAAEPDRLAVAIHISSDVIRALLPPATGEPA